MKKYIISFFLLLIAFTVFNLGYVEACNGRCTNFPCAAYYLCEGGKGCPKFQNCCVQCPSSIPEPTNTPTLTATPRPPTATPVPPTATPIPTLTPTPTPVPPTNTPTPGGPTVTPKPPTPTLNPNCQCTNNICSTNCSFDYNIQVTNYTKPPKCSLSAGLFPTPPTDDQKHGWCKANLRVKGDADSNGVIENTDYFYYLAVVSGGKIPAKVNPDFNGDGEVGRSDLDIYKLTIGIQ